MSHFYSPFLALFVRLGNFKFDLKFAKKGFVEGFYCKFKDFSKFKWIASHSMNARNDGLSALFAHFAKTAHNDEFLAFYKNSITINVYKFQHFLEKRFYKKSQI